MSLVIAFAVGTAAGADWPQWRGVNRDGKSAETGLLASWPEGGPKLLWAATEDLGKGFSSIVVTKGTIYTSGMLKGNIGHVFAFDLNGKCKWKSPYGPEWTKSFPNSRTTPTPDGDRVYVMSGLGRIVCFNAAGGDERWAVDTAKVFGGRNITWGIAEAVLIDGNMAICTPGGPDATMVALDKMTGKTIWTTKGLSDKSAYCSPILIRDDKKNLLVTMTESHVVGIDAADGTVLWKEPYQGQCRAHPVNPLYHDGQVFVTSGYNEGGMMLKLSPDGRGAKVLWKKKSFDTHHGGLVLVDGYLYGTSWDGNRDGNWMCLEWATGKVMYDTHWKCKGSMIFAEGKLYCYEEKGGTLALVKAAPTGFEVISSFQVPKGSGKHWAHPAIANGVLYVRHGEVLMAYDIAAK